jgi:hypothetical protein
MKLLTASDVQQRRTAAATVLLHATDDLQTESES